MHLPKNLHRGTLHVSDRWPQELPPSFSRSLAMYHHVKKLMFTVRVDAPDPRFGNMLLEQFGGANGELVAAMQYSIQGLNCETLSAKTY